MDFLNMILAVSEPTGMWASIIKWIQSGVGNYALTIIILTIAIKIVLLPFDFYQKYITKVNSKKQAKIQPELDKLNARYANNQDMLNQKTMELYKRENYNVVGTCIGMLLNLVLTMVIFFTLFSGINKMQYYTIDQEYLTLQQTYVTTVVENYDGDRSDIVSVDDDGNEVFNWNFELDPSLKSLAEQSVVSKYEEIKTSFLWIKNVWIPDSYKSVIPDYSNYLKITNQKANSDDAIETENKLIYSTVMTPLIDKYDGQWNGYLLLPLIAMGTTILSTMIPTWMEKAKAKKRGVPYIAQQTNKTMLIVMPVILGIFTLFYNAVFGLYIVVGAIFGLITSPLMTMLSEAVENHVEQKQLAKQTTVSYSRKQPVDITHHQNTKANKNNNTKNNAQNKTITKNIQNSNNNKKK